MSSLNVVLAGGGTAGHVNPLIATARELAASGATVTAVGTKDKMEARLVPAAGFPLEFVERAPFPRRTTLASTATLRFPAAFARSVKQAGAILDAAGAEVAVGFGGYVSPPVYVAAKRRGIPIVLHEANARPGMANRLGAKWARAVALTFESTPLAAAEGTTAVVGLPLRAPISELAALDATARAERRRVSARKLGLDPDLPTLLVTGGSLGADHLNRVMAESMAPVRDRGVQVLHLTGQGEGVDGANMEAAVRSALESAGGNERYTVLAYLENMEDAYAAADLVLCRSGAGTVAELGAVGLPAFFVPLGHGNGEQALNADDVVGAGGARRVLDADFNHQVLVNEVLPLLDDREELAKMGAIARTKSPADGSGALADLIYEAAGAPRPERGAR